MEFENSKVGTTASPFLKKVIGGEGISNNKKLPLEVIRGDDSLSGSDVLLCNKSFIKPSPSSKNKNFRRKRTTTSEEEEEDDDDEDDSVADGLNLIHHNNMTSKTNPPHFPKPTDDNNNNNHKLLHFSTTGGPTTKTSSSSLFHFESSRHIQVEGCDNNATATLETETEFSKDSRSMRERVLKQASEEAAAALLMKKGPAAAKNKRANSGSAVDDEKPLYKGILGYTDYRAAFRRDQAYSADKASGAHGPLRSSAHIRVSTRFDYQPDVCKDYKKTGYCGFGDSCKFLHDRGDYKSGWQMGTEWDEAEKVRKRDFSPGVGHDDLDEAGLEEDTLPFACSICRGPFVDPVVTTCKHYFCQQCALKHRPKNKKCFVCNKPTLGIFNTAQKIRKKMAAEGN